MTTHTVNPGTLVPEQLIQPTATAATFLDRIGMASGAIFVILWLYSGFLVAEPPYDFTNLTLAQHYKQYVSNHLLSAHIVAIAFLFFLVFIGKLYHVVQWQDKGRTWLPGALLGSGLMTATMFMISQASLTATALMASRDASPELVRGMDEISHITAHLFAAPVGLFLIIASVSILKYNFLPKWISVPPLIAGVTLLCTTGSFNHKELLHKLGVLCLLVFLLSVFIMSLALLWRPWRNKKGKYTATTA